MSLEAEGHLHRDEDSDDSEDDPFSIQVQSSMNPAITVNQWIEGWDNVQVTYFFNIISQQNQMNYV